MGRASVKHLLSRYGTLAEEVLELAGADPSLARPLTAGLPYLAAEVAYAVSHEGALHADDVLSRRVRIILESAARGTETLDAVTSIMGGLLGWDAARRAAEERRYRAVAALAGSHAPGRQSAA